MKLLKELMEAGYWGDDTTKRSQVVNMDISSLTGNEKSNWAVYAGNRVVARDKTKAEAQRISTMPQLVSKNGKMTIKMI